mgnify:CR=1 FL=1
MIFYGDGAGNSRGVCVNSLVPWRNSLIKVHDIILSIFVHDVTWCMTSLILFSCMTSSVYQFKWGGEPRNLDDPKGILIFWEPFKNRRECWRNSVDSTSRLPIPPGTEDVVFIWRMYKQWLDRNGWTRIPRRPEKLERNFFLRGLVRFPIDVLALF